MRIFILLIYFIVPMSSRAIEVISHRGNTCGAPENTLEGIKKSWEIGVDAVELDVRVSRDSIAYLFHDKTIGNIPIQDLTYHEIITQPQKNQIYNLVEALTIDPSDGYYILDLKDVTTTSIHAVIRAVSESQISETKLAFQSNNIELLSKIKNHYSSSRYFFLERLNRRPPFFLKPKPQIIIKAIEGYGIDGISFKGRHFLNENYLAQFKQSGLDIYVWTINSTDRALYYKGIGVSGIITDNVSAIRQTVTTRQFAKTNCNQL